MPETDDAPADRGPSPAAPPAGQPVTVAACVARETATAGTVITTTRYHLSEFGRRALSGRLRAAAPGGTTEAGG